MAKTSISELIEAHPEILSADTFIVIHKIGDDIRMSVAGTASDVFEMFAGASETLIKDISCPGCPNCQDGSTH
jgi:hypothetical protein